MSFLIHTQGSCNLGDGEWSYTTYYTSPTGETEVVDSQQGKTSGTTARQMKLMAILNAVSRARSLNIQLPIVLKSDCEWCVKCIAREYDCTSDDGYRRDKVSRGYVQYLQEIWWKIGDLDITFVVKQGT